jgi:nucleotide-binding universal stress UspA family protein
MKNILVCIDGSEYSQVAADYALHLAQRLGVDLKGLHVLDSTILETPLMIDVDGWVGAETYGEQLQQFREVIEKRAEAIVNQFNDHCRQAGSAAEATTAMGHPSAVILEQEKDYDLVVMGQKGENARHLGAMPGSTAGRVARHSAKPCLVTPAAFKPVSRILAAFDGTSHARQALQQALALGSGLQVPITVLTAADGAARAAADLVLQQARELAAGFQGQVAFEARDGSAVGVILAVIAEGGFDLLVMGAYGHGRIHEMILGSTTAHLVCRAAIPVLLVR